MGVEQPLHIDIVLVFAERIAGHASEFQPRIKQEELHFIQEKSL